MAADLEAVSQGLQEAYPDTNQDRVYHPVPLLDLMVGEARPQLLLLGGAVGLLLLIVCANLANLLLIRGLDRGQELALRLALGARRSQVVRQLLVETLLLSLIGAVGGVVAAWAVLPLLVRLAGSALPRATEIVLDVRVLLFAVAASLLSGILVGLLPALKASSVHLQQAIEHGSSRISAGVGWRKLLVTVEIGLALTLLVGTGLLVTSLVRVLRLDPGFNPQSAISFQLSLPATRYPGMSDLLTFFSRLQSDLGVRPGIESLGVVSSRPLSGHNTGSALSIEGQPLPQNKLPGVGWQFTLPGYFETLGVEVVDGRDFKLADMQAGVHYSLINQTAARRFFGDASPIGRRIETGVPRGEWHEIIGVVADTRHLALDQQPEPRVYDLFGQHGGRGLYVVVRGNLPWQTLSRTARQSVYRLDPALALQDLRSLEELMLNSTQQRRFLIQLLSLFTLVAVLLAALGIYGVISFWVSRRTREIGIRIALGAAARNVVQLVLKQATSMMAVGIVLGWIGSWLAARAFSSLLFEVDPGDPWTLGMVTLGLMSVILISCYIPARRAARLDPMQSLRSN